MRHDEGRQHNRIALARVSVPAFIRWLPHLTENELVYILDKESIESKRQSIIKRAISRLVAIRSSAYREQLEKQYGRSTIHSKAETQDD